MTKTLHNQSFIALTLAAVLSLVSTPALAETYGPPDESERPVVEEAAERESHERKDAIRWEVAYQVLNAIDTVQTVDCLSRHVCTEANPLFGKRPSKEKLIAGKALLGLGHFLLFSKLLGDDPRKARTMARWSVGIQGTVVVANARFAF